MTFGFTEDADERGFNLGDWVLAFTIGNPDSFRWWTRLRCITAT